MTEPRLYTIEELRILHEKYIEDDYERNEVCKVMPFLTYVSSLSPTPQEEECKHDYWEHINADGERAYLCMKCRDWKRHKPSPSSQAEQPINKQTISGTATDGGSKLPAIEPLEGVIEYWCHEGHRLVLVEEFVKATKKVDELIKAINHLQELSNKQR